MNVPNVDEGMSREGRFQTTRMTGELAPSPPTPHAFEGQAAPTWWKTNLARCLEDDGAVVVVVVREARPFVVLALWLLLSIVVRL